MNKYRNKNNQGVQLISYADSIGCDLKEMEIALDSFFKEAVESIHILPFYPSSADRGFAPLTHQKIDPKFGRTELVSEWQFKLSA